MERGEWKTAFPIWNYINELQQYDDSTTLITHNIFQIYSMPNDWRDNMFMF